MSQASDRIEGTVAQILNLREIVITRGADHGVEDGMVFAVLNRNGVKITDPQTGENLGSVEIPKVLVKIVRVQERLSIGRTFRTKRVNKGGTGSGLLASGLFDPPRWETETETLKIADRGDVVELEPEDSLVQIGDPVVQALGDEFLEFA